MRGKVGYIHPFCHGVGITPAYAGKRSAGREFGTAAWDHPRACGEKAMSVTTMNKSQGSPPRMRGKETDSRRQCCSAGITPAYAGKRTLFCLAGRRNRDHPRVCGEKGRTGALDVVQRGSPPRMRGKVRELLFSFHCARITPAYAGKRLKRSRSTVPPVAIVPLFPSVCNKPVVSDGSPAGRDAPLFLPAENAVPASPAYNLRSL